MKSSQQKFLERFDQLAEKHRLELVVNKGAANVGHGIFSTADFTPLLVFTFNFQSGYCTIKFYRASDHARDARSIIRQEEGFLYYTSAFAIREMFDWTDKFLSRALTPE